MQRTLLLFAAIVAGCHQPPPPSDAGADAEVRADLFFAFPPHRSTNVLGAAPSLDLTWLGSCGAEPDARMDEVERNVRLTREPEGADVPFTIVRRDGASCPVSQVLPNRPLAEGFYLLSVSELPPRVGVAFSTARADGSFGAELHVGSLPLVRRLTGCPEASSATYYIAFSQRMAPDTHEHVTIEGATCGPAMLDSSAELVRFECSGRELTTVTFRLDATAIRSAHGVAMVDDPAADGAYTFVPSAAEEEFLFCLSQYPFWPIAD